MGYQFRLAYAATIPFSRAVTVFLCFFYVLGFAGLLVFNFLTQSKAERCTTTSNATYNPSNCEAGRLEFARTYYSRPVDNVSGGAGSFPWTPLGFGNAPSDNGAIDYSILTTNWTADPLQCVMFEQVLTLHLDSGGWTIAACYYCGGSLRVLCTTLDSERTQVAGYSDSSDVDVGAAFVQYRNRIQSVATTAFTGAIVLSARMVVKRPVSTDIVPLGVLPYNESSSTVVLGTTIGSSLIYTNDTNVALRGLATDGFALSTLAEQATAEDIQPPNSPRTLQATYLCRACRKQYKPTIEIIAVVGAAIFAILTPAFAFARLIAELMAPNPDPEQALHQQITHDHGGHGHPGGPGGAGDAMHTVPSNLYKPNPSPYPSYGPVPLPSPLPYNSPNQQQQTFGYPH